MVWQINFCTVRKYHLFFFLRVEELEDWDLQSRRLSRPNRSEGARQAESSTTTMIDKYIRCEVLTLWVG